MEPLESLELPRRTGNTGKRPWEDLCGGAYFYLDNTDTAYVGTTRRTIVVVATSDMTVERTIDLTDAIPDDDCLVALMPDWDGLGTWWVTQDGRVGHADEAGESTVVDLDEEIANSVSVDAEGLYVVTVEALYKFRVGAEAPETIWRTAYDNGDQLKPGQLSAGQRYDADGAAQRPGRDHRQRRAADERAVLRRLQRRARVRGARVLGGRERQRQLARRGRRRAASWSRTTTATTARSPRPSGGRHRAASRGSTRCPRRRARGRARSRGPPTRSPRRRWPRCRCANGLVYAYTTRSSRWRVQAWYVTAIDAATGRDGVLGPHGHGVDVQQPLRGGHAGARRVALRADAGRHGAAPRRLEAPRAARTTRDQGPCR